MRRADSSQYLRKGSPMATLEHLEILYRGKDAWNKWRKKNPEVRPKLNKVDFSPEVRTATPTLEDMMSGDPPEDEEIVPVDFSKADLHEADMREVLLVQANLSGADLRGADLRGADLTEADLTDVDLRAADLRKATFYDADLAGAKLNGANLSGTDLGQAVGLIQAQINKAKGTIDTNLPPDLVMPKSWERVRKPMRGPRAG